MSPLKSLYREMAQSVNCLPHRHKDLSSDSHHDTKSKAWIMPPCLALGRQRQEEPESFCQLVGLADSLKSSFSERPCIKLSSEEKNIPNTDHWPSQSYTTILMHPHRHMYVPHHTSTHTHTHRYMYTHTYMESNTTYIHIYSYTKPIKYMFACVIFSKQDF